MSSLSTPNIGVAISTTADHHRLALLEQSAQNWWRVLARFGLPTNIFVTVDGDEDACERAMVACAGFAEILRVGQPMSPTEWNIRDGRLGVASNKNTGLEALMSRDVDHLFLSDDDTWPMNTRAVELHTQFGIPHSMVCWGKHRSSSIKWDPDTDTRYGEWSWPRGSVLYAHRPIIEDIGGMIEAFGPGGHEHVEWSRRIHQAGWTPDPYCTPVEYNHMNALGMLQFWHAEDAPMILGGRIEPLGNLRARRRSLTSIRRDPSDWKHIEDIMASRDGDTQFVPYAAAQNGRRAATMCSSPVTSQGAEGQ